MSSTVKERILSNKRIPAGKDTCNAIKSTSDGYCQARGVEPFKRCHTHGGQKAIDLFKKSIPFHKAKLLDILINDTLSMDSELASSKQMLLDELNNYHRANEILKEFTKNIPQRPTPDDEDVEIKSYELAVSLHMRIIEHAEDLKKTSFKNALNLTRILSDGVTKNNKIKEGSKFQLDVKQISRLLKVMLEAHRICQGCPKLKEVLRYTKEHTRDIPLSPKFSKKNKEALGNRTLQEMMGEVEKRMPKDTEAEIIIEDGEIG